MARNWMLVCLFAGAVGCGQSGPAPVTTSETGSATEGSERGPVGEKLAQQQPEVDPFAQEAPPEPGSARWILQEIQQLRLAPLPSLPGDDNDETGVTQTSASAAPSSEQIQETLARTRAIRKERNEQIVKLAMEALAMTAKDPQQEEEFLASVGQLLDARLQLALQGDEDHIAALYDAAEAFHQKKTGSPAAAAAQLTLVNLSHAMSMRYGKSEPRWLLEFSHQAQLYATRFPFEQSRSLPLLMAAGKTCELHGLLDEARSCYGLIPAKFPDSPLARQCEGVLRRLTLVGKPLEFGGPTLDGNFINIDEYVGKAVIIVFWASHAQPFVEQVATIQAVAEKYKRYAQVLSVSLDSEEAEIDAFLEETKLAWPVIFHVEPEKRGWNAPLAAYYGITALPTIWIVDPEGIVIDTQVSAAELQPKLHDLLLKHLNKDISAAPKSSDASRSNRPQ